MATEYKGKLETKLHSGVIMTFNYSYTIDVEDRVAHLKWSVTPVKGEEEGRDANYHLAKGDQHFSIKWPGKNGDLKSYSYDKPESYTDGDHTVYRGYCDVPSWLNDHYNGQVFYDTDGNWTGIRRWVKVLGSKWLNDSCTVYYDSSGNAEFSVKGDFSWYPTKRMTFSKTFQLKSIPRLYKVKFDANGGSNAPNTQNKIEDKTLKITSSKPTAPSGFTFKGWGTSATDTVPNYQPNGSYTANKSITLYAVYSRDITYNGYGGTISGDNKQTKFYKTNLTLFVNSKVSRPGYTLNGWATNTLPATDPNTFKNTGSKQTIYDTSHPGVAIYVYPAGFNTADNNIGTLYAYWQRREVTITLKDFYLNNVAVKNDRIVKVPYGKKPDVSMFTTYKREGYKLLGWSAQNISPYSETPSSDTLNKILFDYTKPYTETGNNVVSITLYPILQYDTTCYVYTETGWKLAIPYVYDGAWKRAIMYGYDNNWKI